MEQLEPDKLVEGESSQHLIHSEILYGEKFILKKWFEKIGWTICHKIERFFSRIQRFFDYAPLVWEDEDWDSAYLLIMMKYKIKRIRENIDRNQNHEGCEADVANMKEIEECLDRIINDNYLDKEWEEFHNKYPMKFEEDKDNPEWSRVVDQGEPCNTIRKELVAKKSELWLKDWNRIWDIMRDESRKWWD